MVHIGAFAGRDPVSSSLVYIVVKQMSHLVLFVPVLLYRSAVPTSCQICSGELFVGTWDLEEIRRTRSGGSMAWESPSYGGVKHFVYYACKEESFTRSLGASSKTYDCGIRPNRRTLHAL